MEINIMSAETSLPLERAHVITMTIRTFKGRRDVDVHLFRSGWDESESTTLDWNTLLGPPIDPSMTSPDGSKKVLMEAFTEEERDTIINYLKDQYPTRITAIASAPLQFPIPLGLPALSDMKEGKSIGFIDFSKIPSYPLTLPLKGLYDLSQHKPLIDKPE